jgi:hypothetical protein
VKGVWEQMLPKFKFRPLVYMCGRAAPDGIHFEPWFNSYCVSYNMTRSNTNDMIQLQSKSGVTVDLSPTSINDSS